MDNVNLQTLWQNLDQSSFFAYMLAIGLSLVFAGLLDLLYRAYFLKDGRGVQVNRAFILIAPAVTAIFLVIQFSLPLSLGLLGALSFVRFRTPIKEPEEIGFILLVIACSLACAVFRFEVSLLLIAVTAAACFIKQYGILSGWFLKRPRIDLFVTGSPQNDINASRDLSAVISKFKVDHQLISKSTLEGETSFHFTIISRKTEDVTDDLSNRLEKVDWVRSTNILLNR